MAGQSANGVARLNIPKGDLHLIGWGTRSLKSVHQQRPWLWHNVAACCRRHRVFRGKSHRPYLGPMHQKPYLRMKRVGEIAPFEAAQVLFSGLRNEAFEQL